MQRLQVNHGNQGEWTKYFATKFTTGKMIALWVVSLHTQTSALNWPSYLHIERPTTHQHVSAKCV